MSRSFVALGSAPFNETPVRFGDADYRRDAHRECQAYIQGIRRYLGDEAPGTQLAVKVFGSDRGTYYEVVCYYEEGDENAEAAARRIERALPLTWEEAGVLPPRRNGDFGIGR